MSEHTKGQWKVMWSEGHAWGPRRIITPKGKDERVAVVSLRGAPQGNPVTAEANARLIAAAPELLEALEPFAYLARVMEPDQFLQFRGVYISYEQAQAAAKAIAKAKGESDDEAE